MPRGLPVIGARPDSPGYSQSGASAPSIPAHFRGGRLDDFERSRRDRALGLSGLQELLDDPILAAVESDHRHASPLLQQAECGGEPSLEALQLRVDHHPDPLKGAGRRVNAPAAALVDLFHEFPQIGGVIEGTYLSFLEDGSDNRLGPRLLSKNTDSVKQLIPQPLVEEPFGRGGTAGVHAHVERTVVPEGKPSSRIVELERGDSQVEKDTVDLPGHVGEDRIRLGKIALPDSDAVPELLEFLPGKGEHVRILVESEKNAIRRGSLEKSTRMSTGPESEIEQKPAPQGLEGLDHLINEDRLVHITFRFAHGSDPGLLTTCWFLKEGSSGDRRSLDENLFGHGLVVLFVVVGERLPCLGRPDFDPVLDSHKNEIPGVSDSVAKVLGDHEA
jgi:hypothetical protein